MRRGTVKDWAAKAQLLFESGGGVFILGINKVAYFRFLRQAAAQALLEIVVCLSLALVLA